MPTCLVTGATGGIGLEFCKQYKEKGWTVVGAVRKTEGEVFEAASKLCDHMIGGVDLTASDHATKITRFLEEKNIALDLLINNAGVFLKDEDLKTSLTTQFTINSLAPLELSFALKPFLKQPSKIAMITSRMGSIEDNTSGGYYGYRASKAALNALGKSLSKDWEQDQIAVGLLHPGYVQTKMTNNAGDITAEVSVQGLIKRIEELNLKNTGGFWHTNGERLPW